MEDKGGERGEKERRDGERDSRHEAESLHLRRGFFPSAALYCNPRSRPGHKPAKPPTAAQESEAVALCPSSLTPL